MYCYLCSQIKNMSLIFHKKTALLYTHTNMLIATCHTTTGGRGEITKKNDNSGNGNMLIFTKLSQTM